MGFSSHPVVKDYMQELENIMVMRDEIKNRLIQTRELISKSENEHEVYAYTKQAADFERQISALTTKGESYIRKVDQLNGVR